MKIFLSWSGEQSRQVAEAFSEWIQCVIQACKPWISTRDIERGSVWFAEISDQIKDITLGVVFLTKENKEKPWILFESGALTKGLTNNRICTFLIDISPGEVDDPLAQFNHTIPNKKGLYALVRTINSSSLSAMDDKILDRIFETYWPDFERSFEKINSDFTEQAGQPAAEADNPNEILNEILASVRTLGNRVARIENQNKPVVFDDIAANSFIGGRSSVMLYGLPRSIRPRTIKEAQGIIENAYRNSVDSDFLAASLQSIGIPDEEARQIAFIYPKYGHISLVHKTGDMKLHNDL